MYPIRKDALQRSLDAIEQAFTPKTVRVVQRHLVIGQYGQLHMWAEPGTYKVGEDRYVLADGHRVMTEAGKLTAAHLHAVGIAEVTYQDGRKSGLRHFPKPTPAQAAMGLILVDTLGRARPAEERSDA